MKKIVSLFVALTMVLLCVPVFGGAAVVSSADTLPAAVDLMKDIHTPPIGNQGGVGACVSYAATYMQYTNAYSRYLHSIAPGITWEPSSGNAAYIFAPRFTYNIGGAATQQVYHILQEQGAPTQTYMQFSGGVTGYASDNALAKDWGTIEGCWEEAQRYRLKDYEHHWAITDDKFYENGIYSGEGAALVQQIKESLNNGNVVVTGGYPDRWVTDLVSISNKGTYGKSGDKAIPYSTNVSSGGHQVSIVGYDDNITCVKNGVTLRGAFKIANSWGSWQNSGCIWMMYDALNGVNQSQYSALNTASRTWTMDQFVFTDWRTDLNYGTPELMAKVTVNTSDRDSFDFTLKRIDPTSGEIASYLPMMYSERSRADYNEGYGFYGAKNGSARDGILTVSYDHFTEDLPAGKTLDDYIWGLEVSYHTTDSGRTSTVKKIEFIKNGVSVYTQSGLSNAITDGASVTYTLNNMHVVTVDAPLGVTVTPTAGAMSGTPGTAFSFSVNVASGYSVKNVLNVYYNGTKIYKDANGNYNAVIANGRALGGNVIKIEGVQPNTVGTFDIQNYGSDFECPYGTFWMVFTVRNSDVNPDVVDKAAIDTGKYKYTVRVTLLGYNIAYDFVPDSYYDWGDSLLFRVPVADQGWLPSNGSTYNLKVEFCLAGIPQFVDENYTVTCRMTPTSNGVASHTHSYTGEIQAVKTASCTAQGSGYKCCSTPGCVAKQQYVLPVDGNAHSYTQGTQAIQTKNATSTAPGEYSYLCTCSLCGGTCYTTAYTYTAQTGDTNGDDRINIKDVTLLINYLSAQVDMDYSALACGGDFTGDNNCTVQDLTWLVYLLDGTNA